jgi:hypothetical protein
MDLIPVGYTSATEEYDGASWATSNPLNTARDALGGTGTQTAGLAFGGQIPPLTAATEEYDGNSWANSNPLNTARVGISWLWNSNSRTCYWWFYSSN